MKVAGTILVGKLELHSFDQADGHPTRRKVSLKRKHTRMDRGTQAQKQGWGSVKPFVY